LKYKKKKDYFSTQKMSEKPEENNGASQKTENSEPPKETQTEPEDRDKRRRSKHSRSRSYSHSRSRSHSPRSRSRSGSPHGLPPTTCLGVFGLSARTNETDLRDEFSRFGELEKVDLIIDKRTGRSRCFGFIYFRNLEDATRAKEACNGMKLHGRSIRTDYSTTSKAHSPTPGHYVGRRSSSRRVDRYLPRYGSRDRYDPYDERDRYYRRDRYHDDRDRYYDDRYDRRYHDEYDRDYYSRRDHY